MQSLFVKLRTTTSCVLLWTVPGLAAASEASSFRLPAPGFVLARATAPAAPEPGTPAVSNEARSLHIVVITGENGANVLRKKSVVRPVVEVRDGQERPVSGALVTFEAPGNGPRVVFGDELRTATALTDERGRASVTDVHAKNAGPFAYEVTAHYQQEMASAVIHQSNFVAQSDEGNQNSGATQSNAAPQPADHQGISSSTLWIIVGCAGAAAVGAAFALARGGSNHTVPTTTSTTIGPGTGVTVGGPH